MYLNITMDWMTWTFLGGVLFLAFLILLHFHERLKFEVTQYNNKVKQINSGCRCNIDDDKKKGESCK